MGGTAANRCLEITTHSHRQDTQSIAPGKLGEQNKMGFGGLIGRGNGHQSLNRQSIDRPYAGDEGVGLAWQNTRLLGFSTGIHLYQQTRTPPDGLGRLGKGTGQLFAVEGLDDIE